jgi:hypothetical protein
VSGEIPVSGRSQPRQGALPAGVAHDVRFYSSPGGGINAKCRPCSWGIWVDDGHDLADLTRLVSQHSGTPAGEARLSPPDAAAVI